ncbi:helix-turn-helix domain-containing protein [Halorubrum sp. RMP-47]|uniref:helix-turn-helix domain-containing protein n=1 Tax=Halorubrum miltondacostae TaxID=3076378 RepID=UPI003527373B
MSVIAEVTIPSTAFELGQILRVEGPTQITLETMVPLGGRPTPFVRIRNDARESFERSVRDHPSVNNIQLVDTYDDETLYSLDWEPSDTSLLWKILDLDAVLLDASGDVDAWQLELRFPSHEALSSFQDHYLEQDIDVTIDRIYNPTKPGAGPWYGLTTPQRETLATSVGAGYYSLPRQISTKELADEFDISDQAVTERLRRGISTLVGNTLLVEESDE